jgi:hypothetical protein
MMQAFSDTGWRNSGTAEQALIEALTLTSPGFATMWRNHDLQKHGEETKRVRPKVGDPTTQEYSSFGVDAQAGLGMIVYMPTMPAGARRSNH